MKRFSMFVLAILAITSLLAACAGPAPTPQTIVQTVVV